MLLPCLAHVDTWAVTLRGVDVYLLCALYTILVSCIFDMIDHGGCNLGAWNRLATCTRTACMYIHADVDIHTCTAQSMGAISTQASVRQRLLPKSQNYPAG